jgi:hypothetical protein
MSENQSPRKYDLKPAEAVLVDELAMAARIAQAHLEGAMKAVIRINSLDPVGAWSLVGHTLVQPGGPPPVQETLVIAPKGEPKT